ncbi:MAG: sensor histidine kinase [Pedobacter sp.]|nr:sensor histidine kinase [Pedobacter sp.]
MKFSLLLFCFCLLLVGQSDGQDQKSLDSLERVFNNDKDDKLKLKLAGDLCWSFGNINFDKALYFGKAELQLASQLGDSASIALAYSDIGNTYTRVNKLKEALAYHLKAYQLRERLGLKAKAAGSISNISIIYKQLGNYREAVNYMHRSLKIYEEAGDEAKQAIVLSNLGNVYMNYEKYAAAKESYDRVVQLASRSNNNALLAGAFSGLMKYYFQLKKYPSALHYGNKAAKLLLQLNLKNDLAAVYNTIGQVYYEDGNYAAAMKYYRESLAFRVFMKDQLGIASCYKNMAACYAESKDYSNAEKYVTKSIEIFKGVDAKDYLREAYDVLGDIYEAKQDYARSLKSFKDGAAMKDSVYNKQAIDRINELQIAYDTEKKAKQIMLLNKENKIQKLLIGKRNTWLGIAAGILFLVFLLAFLGYKGIKLRQDARLQAEVIIQQDLSTKAILNAEENERKRISGELHDGLGQMFSAIKLNLSGLADEVMFKHLQSRELFEKTLNLVDESCKEVRVIAHQMAPNVLLKSGLATAVRDFINKIDSRKLKINLETLGLQDRLDQNIETVLYRVIQETVNNVIKHAAANALDIQLTKDEESINVMIEDNGKGFDAMNLEKFEGIGLKNIRSRIAYLKGSVDFSSSPGAGTLVAIYIPL